MSEMSPAEEIFFAALEKKAKERAAYLDAACAGQPELRARVEKLLAAHPKVGGFLESGAAGTATATFGSGEPEATGTFRETAEAVGTVVAGRYKLLQQIGEGGMGTVWMADQTEPVKRRVAVKLIRVEKGQSKTILSRFEAERQAIALMDHPNIARLLDAGTTQSGSPYFVMELVKGGPLTDFCDAHKLGIPERLALFVQICSAVQHAHQKGIIHRDLKPSNILVESHDGKPVPKVIDFGLAKATSGLQLTEHTMFTAFGSVMGTPLYMAPEQATFNAVDVDTRADVYALGVILYELLTGTTPLARETVKKAALDEMLKLIREQEAPAPSSRLSSAGSSPSVAANRQTEPAKLGRFVKGELDWIVLKALSKERDRRYETANGFAKDIERFLNHEPVTAGPVTARYRLKKFVRRNRGQVIAASLILFALLAGMAGTTLGLLEARQQERAALLAKEAEAERAEGEKAAKELAETKRQEAENQQKRAEAGEKLAGERLVAVEAEKKRADEERQIAQAVNDFLQNKLLAQADTTAQANGLLRTGGASAEAKLNPTVRELLDRAAKELAPDKIEANFPKQPFVQAQILATVGNTYLGIGEAATAIDLLKRSAALYRQHLGPDHRDTFASRNNLAYAYLIDGNLDIALPLCEETLKLSQATLGPEHPQTLQSMSHLALAYNLDGKPALAVPLAEETLKFRKAQLGTEHSLTIESMGNLGVVYRAAGKLDLAVPLLEETLKIQKAKLGTEHPSTLNCMNNLATAYREAGKLDKALPLFEETLKLSKTQLGPDHPETLYCLGNFAKAYQDAGKLDKALPLFEESLKLRKAKLGPEHKDTLTSMNNLALAYLVARKPALALPIFEEAFKLSKANLGLKHGDTLRIMNGLAEAYQAVGKWDRARPIFEEAFKLSKAKLGADHENTLRSMNGLATCYLEADKFDLAQPLYEELLKIHKAKSPPEHPNTLATMNNLAVTYRGLKRFDLALPLFEQLLAIQEKKVGRTHPDVQWTVANLGMTYLDLDRVAEAVPLLEEAHRASKVDASLRWVSEPLLNAYVMAGKPAEAKKLIDELLANARKALPKDSPQLAGLLAPFGLLLLDLKAFAEAEPLLRESLAIREKTQPNAWTTFNTYSLLGGAIFGQKKHADAEPLLLKGYEGMKAREKAIPPQGATRIPEALDRLIDLYTATNKPDEAAKWRAERAKYPNIAPPPREKK